MIATISENKFNVHSAYQEKEETTLQGSREGHELDIIYLVK